MYVVSIQLVLLFQRLELVKGGTFTQGHRETVDVTAIFILTFSPEDVFNLIRNYSNKVTAAIGLGLENKS